MTTERARFGWAVATMALYAVSAWGEHGAAQDQVDQSRDEPVDILTRGPVHEAFAKPVLLTPKPTTMIPKRPPTPIEEEPPEQKPDDDSLLFWGVDPNGQRKRSDLRMAGVGNRRMAAGTDSCRGAGLFRRRHKLGCRAAGAFG